MTLTIHDAMYDAIIVGAGPAGATAALLLARQGFSVALLDKARFPRDKPCAEYLSPEVSTILHRLGVLDDVLTCRHAELRGFRLFTQSGALCQASFAGAQSAGQIGRHHLTGLSINRLTFDHLLVRAAVAAGAALFEGQRVTDVLDDDGLGSGVATISRDDGPGMFRGRLVIAADGIHSTIGRRLGLLRPAWGPRVISLVTHMEGIAALDDYGEMHVGPRGYCGIGDVGGGEASVSIVVPQSEGPRLRGRVRAYMNERLAEHPALAPRLTEARPTREVLAIGPLCFQARRLSGHRLLLLGDAAGYYDPFTGEGIYKAMRSAELAVRVAVQALRANDLSATSLSRYDWSLRRVFAGKRLVEQIVHEVVSRPWLADRVANQLLRRPQMADTLVGVTGDFVSPARVLTPAYLARLVV